MDGAQGPVRAERGVRGVRAARGARKDSREQRAKRAKRALAAAVHSLECTLDEGFRRRLREVPLPLDGPRGVRGVGGGCRTSELLLDGTRWLPRPRRLRASRLRALRGAAAFASIVAIGLLRIRRLGRAHGGGGASSLGGVAGEFDRLPVIDHVPQAVGGEDEQPVARRQQARRHLWLAGDERGRLGRVLEIAIAQRAAHRQHRSGARRAGDSPAAVDIPHLPAAGDDALGLTRQVWLVVDREAQRLERELPLAHHTPAAGRAAWTTTTARPPRRGGCAVGRWCVLPAEHSARVAEVGNVERAPPLKRAEDRRAVAVGLRARDAEEVTVDRGEG